MEFYKFLSLVKYFLKKLLKDPINCDVDERLKKLGLNKKRLIEILIKRNVLERHEKIKSVDGKEMYFLKYKVRAKDFEKRIHRLYIRFCEKNTPNKKNEDMTILSECDGGCACGGGEACAGSAGGGGATSTTSIGSYQYDTPFLGHVRGVAPSKARKKKKKKNKTVRITESQFRYIQECINAVTLGDKDLTD